VKALGRPSPLTVNLSVAAMCLIWGSTWIVIRGGLRDLPPLTALALRFTLAAAAFALVAPVLQRREGGEAPTAALAWCMALLNLALPFGIVYWGELVIPSGLASVLWAVFPMFVAVLGQRFLAAERLAAGHWIGFALGFCGVGLLFLTDLRGIGPGALGRGAVYLLSPLVAAIGVTLIKRHGERVSSVRLNRAGLALAALVVWALALAVERGAEVRWTAFAVFSIVYLALAGTVVTFGLFYWLMRYAPAYKLSLVSYVVPLLALLLGRLLGAEAIGPHTLAGAALILVGVALGRRPPAAPDQAEPSGSAPQCATFSNSTPTQAEGIGKARTE
jgi:drug/metabolite transporter (DMT)-like permease